MSKSTEPCWVGMLSPRHEIEDRLDRDMDFIHRFANSIEDTRGFNRDYQTCIGVAIFLCVYDRQHFAVDDHLHDVLGEASELSGVLRDDLYDAIYDYLVQSKVVP